MMLRRLALSALIALAPTFASAQMALIAPTAPANDNTDRIANTAFVKSAIGSILPTPTRAGDIIYWNGSAWVTLAGNNSGTQFLQENSSGLPSWVAAAGVTQVTCGTGLSGGTITTTGTCAVNYAVKSDQQTGTSTILAVNPSIQQQHDSAAKAWVSFTASTGAIVASYNVSSVTRSGAGVYVVNFTTPFATATYSCEATVTASSFVGAILAIGVSKTASAYSFDTATSGGTPGDAITNDVVCFGRQ